MTTEGKAKQGGRGEKLQQRSRGAEEQEGGGEKDSSSSASSAPPLCPSACCAMMSACERSKPPAGDSVFRPPAVFAKNTDTLGSRGRRSAGAGEKDHANARTARRSSAQGPQHLLALCHPVRRGAARSGKCVAQQWRAAAGKTRRHGKSSGDSFREPGKLSLGCRNTAWRTDGGRYGGAATPRSAAPGRRSRHDDRNDAAVRAGAADT